MADVGKRCRPCYGRRTSSERKIGNQANPVLLTAALYDKERFINRLSNGHPSVDHEYPRHRHAFLYSVQGKAGYGAPIVSEQDPALIGRPLQNGPIVGL